MEIIDAKPHLAPCNSSQDANIGIGIGRENVNKISSKASFEREILGKKPLWRRRRRGFLQGKE